MKHCVPTSSKNPCDSIKVVSQTSHFIVLEVTAKQGRWSSVIHLLKILLSIGFKYFQKLSNLKKEGA